MERKRLERIGEEIKGAKKGDKEKGEGRKRDKDR